MEEPSSPGAVRDVRKQWDKNWLWISASLLIAGGLFVLARFDLLGETLYRWAQAITEFLIPGSS